jgi:hypothetical protein
MKKLLITALIFFSITCAFAQNSNKNKSVSNNERSFIEQDYKYVSLEIIGLDSEEKEANLEIEISNNPNFRNVIVENNNLIGYVKKDYSDNLSNFFKNQGFEIIYNNKINKKLAPVEGSKIIVIPEDMKPKYIDTGNPEQDKQRYTEAKKNLLEEHPEFIQQ